MAVMLGAWHPLHVRLEGTVDSEREEEGDLVVSVVGVMNAGKESGGGRGSGDVRGDGAALRLRQLAGGPETCDAAPEAGETGRHAPAPGDEVKADGGARWREAGVECALELRPPRADAASVACCCCGTGAGWAGGGCATVWVRMERGAAGEAAGAVTGTLVVEVRRRERAAGGAGSWVRLERATVAVVARPAWRLRARMIRPPPAADAGLLIPAARGPPQVTWRPKAPHAGGGGGEGGRADGGGVGGSGAAEEAEEAFNALAAAAAAGEQRGDVEAGNGGRAGDAGEEAGQRGVDSAAGALLQVRKESGAGRCLGRRGVLPCPRLEPCPALSLNPP